MTDKESLVRKAWAVSTTRIAIRKCQKTEAQQFIALPIDSILRAANCEHDPDYWGWIYELEDLLKCAGYRAEIYFYDHQICKYWCGFFDSEQATELLLAAS